jgi:hypothetical protein
MVATGLKGLEPVSALGWGLAPGSQVVQVTQPLSPEAEVGPGEGGVA